MTRELTKEDIREVKNFAENKGLGIYEKMPGVWVIYKEYEPKDQPGGKGVDWIFKGDVVSAMIFLINYQQP